MTERSAEVLYPAQLVARRRAVRRARAVRIRRTVVAVVGVASLLYWGWALAHSRLFALNGIEIAGAPHVTRAEVLTTGHLHIGMNMLSIDPKTIEGRLESIPIVAVARVERLYPSKVRITITERVPAVVLEVPDAAWLLDARGVAIAAVDVPPSLAVVRFGHATPVVLGLAVDPSVRDGLDVWNAVPRSLRARVSAVDVTDPTDVLVWMGRVRVDLGDTTQLADKFAALGAVVADPSGRALLEVNVTAPARPAARYAP